MRKQVPQPAQEIRMMVVSPGSVVFSVSQHRPIVKIRHIAALLSIQPAPTRFMLQKIEISFSHHPAPSLRYSLWPNRVFPHYASTQRMFLLTA
jgi:hypothetical protein